MLQFVSVLRTMNKNTDRCKITDFSTSGQNDMLLWLLCRNPWHFFYLRGQIWVINLPFLLILIFPYMLKPYLYKMPISAQPINKPSDIDTQWPFVLRTGTQDVEKCFLGRGQFMIYSVISRMVLGNIHLIMEQCILYPQKCVFLLLPEKGLEQ